MKILGIIGGIAPASTIEYYRLLESLRERSPIPLISIVEATCSAVRMLGLKRPGLIGTRFTMQGSFYPEVFSRHGISLLKPGEADQAFIHDKYMGELANGVFPTQTRDRVLEIAARMRKELGMDGLILGGTELPLLLRADSLDGMPLLDTAKIHVNDALARMLS